MTLVYRDPVNEVLNRALAQSATTASTARWLFSLWLTGRGHGGRHRHRSQSSRRRQRRRRRHVVSAIGQRARAHFLPLIREKAIGRKGKNSSIRGSLLLSVLGPLKTERLSLSRSRRPLLELKSPLLPHPRQPLGLKL